MNDDLIKESLKQESSFSSNIHGIESITKDVNVEGLVDYPIPQRYHQLKLVLMPVNIKTYYFYWDFPEQFLHDNIVSIEDISFHIIDQNHELIAQIPCTYPFGQYFYTLNQKAQKIKIIAVYKHGIQYKNLLESNSVNIFNNSLKYGDKDIWIEKRRGFTEVIRASMNHFTLGMSSKSYVDEIRMLEEYSKQSIQGISSDALGGK